MLLQKNNALAFGCEKRKTSQAALSIIISNSREILSQIKNKGATRKRVVGL
jgi:hypothetical protein